jgi:predicted nucleotidyltransferase
MVPIEVVESEVIPAMVRRIIDGFSPLKIILFGSHARNEANKHSDIDLLVVFPYVDDLKKTTIDIRRALADFPVPKDVVVTTTDEIERRGDLIGTVLRPALREGRVLYERT